MRRKEIAIIDIRSSRITAVILERSVNNTFDVKWTTNCSYSRFYEKRFIDSGEVQSVVADMLESFKKYFGRNDYNLYIGVPGCFTNPVTKRRQFSFGTKKKIKYDDTIRLQENAMGTVSVPGFRVIFCSPVVYELDDFRVLYNPIGETSETLRANLSFVLCSNYFLGVLQPVFERAGLAKENVRYVPVALAECNYLIPGSERNKTAMLLDIGASSATFSVIQGEGMIYEHSFDYGGDMITGEISQFIHIEGAEESFEIAEELKLRTSLSTIYSDDEKFSGIEGLKESVRKKTVQQAVADCINKIGDVMTETIEDVAKLGVSCNKLYITGGGITYIRGAKEMLSMRLGVPVEVVSPSIPHYDRPTESSYLSVADFAYNNKD